MPVYGDVSRDDGLAARRAAYFDVQLGAAGVTESRNVLRIVAREPVAPIADRMENAEELLTRL